MRNYLRVRGEYSISDAELLEQLELPPRARRIPARLLEDHHPRGTTSACAENTLRDHPRRRQPRNYLRVRGEYEYEFPWYEFAKELPPRARRIPHNYYDNEIPLGTTSACAENTCSSWDPPRVHRNYLRVRGEYAGQGG